MSFFKHILVVVALLAAMLPCSHAEYHDHHEHDAAMAEPCECHSCNHPPCPDSVEIELDHNTPDSNTIVPPSTPVLLFVLPETKFILKQTLPPASGTLAVLQTVQLLI